MGTASAPPREVPPHSAGRLGVAVWESRATKPLPHSGRSALEASLAGCPHSAHFPCGAEGGPAGSSLLRPRQPAVQSYTPLPPERTTAGSFPPLEPSPPRSPGSDLSLEVVEAPRSWEVWRGETAASGQGGCSRALASPRLAPRLAPPPAGR